MAGKNTEVKIISPKQVLPDLRGYTDSRSDWSQGDYLIFDTVNTIVRPATGEAEAGLYGLGIATQDAENGIPVGPYGSLATAAAATSIAMNGPIYGNTFKMVAKTGDTFYKGQPVYAHPSTGNRGVAATAAATATAPVGVYVGPITVSSAAAGTEIECLIGSAYPTSVLKF